MGSAVVQVKKLTIGYAGDEPLLKNADFEVNEGEIFAILGGSGCGKSTLLKHMIGLLTPLAGEILINGCCISSASAAVDDRSRREIMRGFGVTYQGGALFGSLSVAENVALPLQEYTDMGKDEIAAEVEKKLAMVELGGFGDYMPAEISGGMRKRAGLARALALNPKLLFFDEPSAGLDPITSAELDKLILQLRDKFDNTVVIVTHELDSIFAVADRVIMLDKNSRSIAAEGRPAELRDHSPDAWVRAFLTRNGMKRQD